MPRPSGEKRHGRKIHIGCLFCQGNLCHLHAGELQKFSDEEVEQQRAEGKLVMVSYCHQHGGFWGCPCAECKAEAADAD